MSVPAVGILAAALTFISGSPAAAQPAAATSPAAQGGTPGLILGPAALPPGAVDKTCGTGPAGLAQWGTDRIEQGLTLTGAQRDRFNDLKAASAKAVKYLHDSCPTSDPVTPTGRLEVMQQRLEAMLEAVREVRPALDAFYATLTDEQKARLAVVQPADDSEPSPDEHGRGHRRHGRHHFLRFRLPFPF
jgi:hypothetical protein